MAGQIKIPAMREISFISLLFRYVKNS